MLLAGLLPIGISVFIIPLPLPVQIFLASAIAIAFYRADARLGRLARADSICGLRWQTDTRIAVIGASGQTIATGEVAQCFISPALTTLRIRNDFAHPPTTVWQRLTQAQHYTALVASDSLPADDYRQLRLRLKQANLLQDDDAKEKMWWQRWWQQLSEIKSYKQ